jgi:hypothetical protein
MSTSTAARADTKPSSMMNTLIICMMDIYIMCTAIISMSISFPMVHRTRVHALQSISAKGTKAITLMDQSAVMKPFLMAITLTTLLMDICTNRAEITAIATAS